MQIFISYAREDYPTAKRLFDALRSMPDIEPWLDKESLLPGVDWKEEILRAIDQSHFVILLLSNHSIEKDGFVQREVNEALERFHRVPPGRIFLIPVRVTNCEPKHRKLRDLNWVDLFEDYEKGVQDIVRALTANKPTTTSFDDYISSLTDVNPKAAPIIQSHPRGKEILRSMYSLRSNKLFPRLMSIDGELAHNPIYEELDGSTDPLVVGGTLGTSLRIMLLDLYLVKALDKDDQPLLLQYFSGTDSAGWKTWLFPHGLGFQRSSPDVSERMALNARDFEVTAGLKRNSVTINYAPGTEYLVSVKPDFGYRHELVLYCFLFSTVTVKEPPKRFMTREYEVNRGSYRRKFRWFYFEELQNDKDMLLKNSDVIKSLHTIYATSLVQVSESVASSLAF